MKLEMFEEELIRVLRKGKKIFYNQLLKNLRRGISEEEKKN